MPVPIVIALNAVIVAVTREVPRMLTVRWHDPLADRLAGLPPALAGDGVADALPSGPLDPEADRKLERAVRRWVRGQTGLELGYVEQLYTFGDRDREPGAGAESPRAVSVAYLALVREDSGPGTDGAAWRDVYRFFPWEDWREGRPGVIGLRLVPALGAWVRSARDGPTRAARRERIEITFGLGSAGWDGERVLERYELLYEAGLVAEAWRDRAYRGATEATVEMGRALEAAGGEPVGAAMALDHRRIGAAALGRLRGKLAYRPVVFELLAPTFTLLGLQRVVEALAGMRLHKGNFRRLVDLEGTGERVAGTGGRPAELFRFRREVLRERKDPGVGLPRA